MARALHRLTAKAVEKLHQPGRHADGGGLYLSISRDGRRRWVFLYRRAGKRNEMGLGSPRDVSLGRARELAIEARAALRDGRSPLDLRKTQSVVPTFGELANEVASSLEPGWRSSKHRQQWRSSLSRHAKPLSGLPVDAVTTSDVLGVVKPIMAQDTRNGAAGARAY
jgi:Arm DNA-binding domain